MNLYLLRQDLNVGSDTFNACLVAAPDEETAQRMHPRGDRDYIDGFGWQDPSHDDRGRRALSCLMMPAGWPHLMSR